MKVSIPKADIDRIMADYNCTQEEATKAYLKAASAANEVFQETIAQNLKKMQSITSQSIHLNKLKIIWTNTLLDKKSIKTD